MLTTISALSLTTGLVWVPLDAIVLDHVSIAVVSTTNDLRQAALQLALPVALGRGHGRPGRALQARRGAGRQFNRNNLA